MEDSGRLDGWKEIAGYMKRDRSTVIRWRSCGLPVRNIPGSHAGSVFAFKDELDSWLAKSGSRISDEPTPPAPPVAANGQPFHGPARRRKIPGIAILLIAAAFIAAATTLGFVQMAARNNPVPPQLDATTQQLYVRARVDWARRTPVDLRNAIDELYTVIRRQPKFAPAYAALADAYLLSFEFGVMSQPASSTNAESAARSALALDPGCADANRAMGFIAYWWHHDNASAREYFLHALDSEPGNAQTHFWYGNALMNNGDAAAGLDQLNEARRLDPESTAIEADYAWAKWQTGPEAEAVGILENLQSRAPTLITPPLYLALIAFARGDWASYLAQAEKTARLYGDSHLAARIVEQQIAFAQNGANGLLDVIASAPPSGQSTFGLAGTELPAAAAAFLGRRERLVELMARAEANGETWGPRHWTSLVFQRWRGDPGIVARLNRLLCVETASERLAP